MDYEFVKIPKVLEKKEYYPDGANVPTQCTVHRCLCGKGTIEFHCVPGFDDEWFEIKCLKCEKKYEPFIDRCGPQWKVYPISED